MTFLEGIILAVIGIGLVYAALQFFVWMVKR